MRFSDYHLGNGKAIVQQAVRAAECEHRNPSQVQRGRESAGVASILAPARRA